ncbi:MAG TPA: DUF4062 domain-containing protein [Longimicrobium sp.]|jgi:hypothetical protein|uniref:DUF4062 domain-containing protein n=1 Tax=Longimicrobium sp. TaxID=2029185 RepID=UPI002ED845E7
MEKRYQIFVSSTFSDLRDEREAVLRSIRALYQMAAGMELFPATDARAWEVIEGVIAASDYYVLVIGGRYGSLDENGISYTEKEYDYARANGKPIIAFLHGDPNELPRGRTETDGARWDKLLAFRSKVEALHHCKYWKDAAELEKAVLLSLPQAIRTTPAIGWIRADSADTPSTDIQDDRVPGYLRDIVKLHGVIARKTRFRTADNEILEYLVKYYMSGYASALKEVHHYQRLSLPSEPRLEVAIRMIAGARDVRAVSIILPQDQWLLTDDGSPYVRVNIEAARRGAVVRRVFVVENQRDLRKIAGTVRALKAAGTDVRCAVRKELEKAVDKVVNLLICDRRIATVSADHTKHDGLLVMSPGEVGIYRDRFRLIWGCSHECPSDEIGGADA